MAGAVIGAVLIGTEIAGTALQANAQREAEEATQRALRQRMVEERLSAAQKANAKDEQMRKLLGHQISQEATSGFELSSPTFQAITIDDFNKFAEDRKTDELQAEIGEGQLRQDMQQSKMQFGAQIGGDVVGLAGSIASQTGLFEKGSSADFDVPESGGSVTKDAQGELIDEESDSLPRRKSRSPNRSLFDDVGD